MKLTKEQKLAVEGEIRTALATLPYPLAYALTSYYKAVDFEGKDVNTIFDVAFDIARLDAAPDNWTADVEDAIVPIAFDYGGQYFWEDGALTLSI
ncbi:MAG: hypothetical protein IJ692_07135 [Alloprevotella sp.]|nr:hypothetical protein [Alloprevotella sp.]MBR1653139.1 hypothetical protein [Alloprevotella sp.]